MALQWYLGLDLLERVPDHGTISQLRRRKPVFRKVFRRLFEEVVQRCVEKGLVSGRLVVTDSTHMKANASRASEYEVDAEEEAGNYWEQLDAYEEEVLEELGIDFFVVPQPAHDRTKAELKRDAFIYDEGQDVCRCPTGKELRPKRLYRSGSGLFWEYWADKKDCDSCPLGAKCLNETDKAGTRKLQDSYFKPLIQRLFSRRWEPEYREALKQRQVWCEGTFAAQKWGHNLTRVLRRGLEAAQDHCLLSAVALNIKRMMKHYGLTLQGVFFLALRLAFFGK